MIPTREFIEKYWKVNDGYGNLVPLKLSDDAWKVIEISEELNVEPYVILKGRSSTKIIANPIVSDEIEKRKKLSYK